MSFEMLNKRSFFRLLAQVSLFAVVVWFLVSRLQIDEVVPALKSFSFLPLVLATTFMILRFVLLGLRWSLSLTTNRPPLYWSILTEWRILFLEFVIPIPDAEDVFRIMLLKLRNVQASAAIRGIIRMRIAGITVLVSLLLLFFLSWGQLVLGQKSTALYSIIAVFILLILPFADYFLRLSVVIIRHIPKIGHPLVKTINEALLEPKKSGLIAVLIFISIAQAMVQASVIFVLLGEMNQSVSFLDLLILVPLLNLSFILPLSLQGFGLPEACLILMLPYFGVPLEQATAVAVVHLLIYSTMIFLGACLFLISSELTLKGIFDMFKKPKDS